MAHFPCHEIILFMTLITISCFFLRYQWRSWWQNGSHMTCQGLPFLLSVPTISHSNYLFCSDSLSFVHANYLYLPLNISRNFIHTCSSSHHLCVSLQPPDLFFIAKQSLSSFYICYAFMSFKLSS